MFEVQEEREEPPPNGAFTKVRSPVANTFSTLSNLKSTLNRSGRNPFFILDLKKAKSAGGRRPGRGSASSLFSSQALYP